MSPLVIPTLVRFALGAMGAAAAVHWAVKEARRINQELDRAKARAKAAKAVDPRREALPTLRRDPVSGEWRVT